MNEIKNLIKELVIFTESYYVQYICDSCEEGILEIVGIEYSDIAQFITRIDEKYEIFESSLFNILSNAINSFVQYQLEQIYTQISVEYQKIVSHKEILKLHHIEDSEKRLEEIRKFFWFDVVDEREISDFSYVVSVSFEAYYRFVDKVFNLFTANLDFLKNIYLTYGINQKHEESVEKLHNLLVKENYIDDNLKVFLERLIYYNRPLENTKINWKEDASFSSLKHLKDKIKKAYKLSSKNINQITCSIFSKDGVPIKVKQISDSGHLAKDDEEKIDKIFNKIDSDIKAERLLIK